MNAYNATFLFCFKRTALVAGQNICYNATLYSADILLIYTQDEPCRIYVQKNLGHGGYGIVYRAAISDKDKTERKICLKMVTIY